MTVTPTQIALLKGKAQKAVVLGNCEVSVEVQPHLTDMIPYIYYASPERILHLIEVYERKAQKLGDCPRCGLGIDSNNDGDCLVCHSKTDAEVMGMQIANMKMLDDALTQSEKAVIGARLASRLMGIEDGLSSIGDGHYPEGDLSATGIGIVLSERIRQIKHEGWTAEHDAEHIMGEMPAAAISYTCKAIEIVSNDEIDTAEIREQMWPWDADWWKPSDDPIRNLAKAAALLVAEIDRLLAVRHAAAAPPQSPPDSSSDVTEVAELTPAPLVSDAPESSLAGSAESEETQGESGT